LDTLLAERGLKIDLVIYLSLPEDVIISRIEDRWIHLPSGRVYHLTYNPPKVPFKDDITGEPLSKRPDDDPNTIRIRLKQYHESISPILHYYQISGVLSNVQGESSDAIYPIIKEHVTHMLNKEMKL